MPRDWPTLSRSRLADCRVFTVDSVRRRAPHTGREHEVFVIDAADWVNVVALTPDERVVLVRQFRHGIAEATCEIPGGMVDPEDSDPLAAARRELLEETGHASETWETLGVVTPNPAIQSNRCHTFLARDARRVQDPRPSPGEDLSVELVTLDELHRRVGDGRIHHALVVAAVHHLGRHLAARAAD